MGGQRDGILAFIQRELCAKSPRQIRRKDGLPSIAPFIVPPAQGRRFSPFESDVISFRKVDPISPLRISPSRLFFPFSGVPLLSSNPSGIHPSRISRLLILISPCESFLFSCYFRPPRFRFSLPRFLFTFSFYPFLSLISFLVLNTNHNSTRGVKWSIFRVFYLNATVYFFK